MDPIWVPLRPSNNIQQHFQPAFQLEIFDTKANAWKLCHLNEERDCGDIDTVDGWNPANQLIW